jgi:hypothetical protein
MTESLSQKELNQLIMQAALAACFKPNEEFLSEDQVIARNYAPTEYFGKSCIASLIDSGLIEFTRIDPAFPLDGNECTLFIKCPAKVGDDLDSFIYKRAENIVNILAQSEIHTVYLKVLTQEVTACECIEYCEFYAKRAQLEIINANHNNARLRLLLLECDVDKIQMLMWRAIKTLANKATPEIRCIEFADIIDITFDRYTHYKRINVDLEGYKRPSILKTSVLSGFLELYRNDD